MAEQPRIRGMLRALGVHPQDREDLTQQVLFGAWRAIEEGRYRPDPDRDPSYALRAWLMGIAWRKASHYHGRAHRRREIAVGLDPWYLAEEGSYDPAGRLEAREALRGLERVPWPARRVLILLALGYGGVEISRKLGVPIGTGFGRIRKARSVLSQPHAPSAARTLP
ncbi:RNA polymerase sigma factor [Sorangium sp. So ce1097]|uniref:RNA polymerase sigma factor n=1 Tax=Sorangium sp. So ce1097 TaxID=3133330 RepID=UPI003F6420FF